MGPTAVFRCRHVQILITTHATYDWADEQFRDSASLRRLHWSDFPDAAFVTRCVTATLERMPLEPTLPRFLIIVLIVTANLFAWLSAIRAESPTRDDVIAQMRPYSGSTAWQARSSGLQGKVLCGYQGWFTTPTDGAGRGWRHYQRAGRFEPGHCAIDLWPDTSEFDEDEKFATPFRHDDGSVAYVFSSHHAKTVQRHFRWMREYGIDGAFVQRFAVETRHPLDLRHCNQVLAHCRRGANEQGRSYAVMYDLSGLRAEQIDTVIEDWKLLVDRLRIGRDDRDLAYLQDRGKPLVAVWGIGFNDGRKYSLAECERLVRFLKEDPTYGGCSVMLGVPTGWRTLDRDSSSDKKLHDVLLLADIISPWTVGRYTSPQSAAAHAERCWHPDLEWCRQRGKEYLPVVFPGFSWHNLKPDFPLDQIPRLRGRFLWTQYVAAKRAGATMVYQAMFDELDEGTAVFKCTPSPPVGASRFVAEQGVGSDHYLWLTGMGGRMLRGELESSDEPPTRR